MSILAILENGLFALGQVLRFPVMLLLWICVIMTVYYAAATLAEAVRRAHERAGFDLKRWIRRGPVLAEDAERYARLPRNLRSLLADIRSAAAERSLSDGGLENLVAEHEEQVRHAMDGPRALVKVGPSLGLLGTLIPMGSSLAAMANGDLNAMAGQMVVAFTTTIIGLATGTVAFALVALRGSWVSATIREQRYVAEVVAAEMERP